jgi:hypothetical protein
MSQLMTMITKSNEVFFRVVARATAEPLVVDLKVLPGSTGLTHPTIPLENLSAQLLIGVVV